MKLRPLHDKIVIRREKPNDRTASGLFIPERAKQNSDVATVLAVGPGRTLENGTVRPCDVRAEDRILVSTEALADWQKMTVGGEEVFVVTESEVLAVLEK